MGFRRPTAAMEVATGAMEATRPTEGMVGLVQTLQTVRTALLVGMGLRRCLGGWGLALVGQGQAPECLQAWGKVCLRVCPRV